MKVFDLDRTLTENYGSFARSFTKIRATDIKAKLDEKFAAGRYCPDPLISINPHFERGPSVDALVRGGTLHPLTGDMFRVDGATITLHRHQEQAVAKAVAGQSFVVTTGTGSGKSLCFFVPIIDAAVRARASGEAPRTRAIIVYPMNALANSQIKEIDKFLDQAGLPPELRPKVARYTGQESQEEREQIRKDKPDVLLTNFMMLELLMTRQSDLDRQGIENAQGLQFIVLDELHTYRGRQGADGAVLVRRLRDRCCPGAQPICIGTSAILWRYWSRRETPEQRARRLEAEARARREAEEERAGLLGRAIPPDIQRDMREFLRAGNFTGEEQSPLAYVGYKVGKTHGLPPWDRQRRLTACFQTEIPRQLAAQYQDWGRPATYLRFASICQHLRMLANTRRQRANYEYAVADWETDEKWFRSDFNPMADRLRRHGFQA